MTIYDCCKGCCKIEVVQYMNNKDKSAKRKSTKKAGMFIYDYINGKVLIVQSRGNLWGVPKGTFEEGENSMDCAIREVREETGLNIEKERLNRCYCINNDAYYYLLNIKQVDVTIQDNIVGNDVNGIGWIKIDCLKELIRIGTIKLNHHSRLCFKNFLNIDLPFFKFKR